MKSDKDFTGLRPPRRGRSSVNKGFCERPDLELSEVEWVRGTSAAHPFTMH
jgi:hypothetical protein